MAYWLFKSEPDTWSWDRQAAAGARGVEWDGVRNYQARNNMDAMKPGEEGFFYHSGDERAVVGIVRVVAPTHPDSTTDDDRWRCIDLAAVKKLPRAVTLEDIKAEPRLADMVLVRNSRLSVQPVGEAEWRLVCKLAGL